MACTFWLGTHQTEWVERTDVPLLLCARRLRQRRLPRALKPWALDSGAFTEISAYGQWTVSPQQYAAEVRRWRDAIGNLQWAVVQDWPCEPFVVAKSGFSVAEHQRRTTHSYLTLKSIAPEIPWVPVLQGWHPDDYLRHLDEYHRALPFPLSGFRLVGLGSVCRRQHTSGIEPLVQRLHAAGLRLHGFGLKLQGLLHLAPYLMSADSMAWSSHARRGRIRLAGCTHTTCTNCLRYALHWRSRLERLIVRGLTRPRQPLLF